MKKILSTLLIVFLLFSLIACVATDETAAREAAEGFLDGISMLDAERAKVYVDDASKIEELFKDLNTDILMGQLPAEFSDYYEEFEELINLVIDEMSARISYEITDVQEIDGEFVYTVDITYPDGETDFEAIFANALSDEVVNDILLEIINSGKITAESTEKEILDIVLPRVFEIAKEAVTNMEITTTNDEAELVVIEKDGKWLVSVEKSGF